MRSDEPRLDGWTYDRAGLHRLPYAQGLLLEGRLLDTFLCARFAPGASAADVLANPARCAEPTGASASLRQAVAQGLAVGVFAQASYRLAGRLKAVFGLRYDGNDVRENQQVSLRVPRVDGVVLQRVDDFGRFVSPRAAVIATLGRGFGWTDVPGRLILKAVYSAASQQPPNFQRFATEPAGREFASPFLGREKATNTELSAAWEPKEGARVEVSAFKTRYSDVLHTALTVDTCWRPMLSGQFQSIGSLGGRPS